MRDAQLSRALFGIPVLLGSALAVGLYVTPPPPAPLRLAAPDLSPSTQPASATPASRRVAESFAELRQRVRQHIARLGDRLPPELVIVEQPPFLVVGEEPAPRVRHHVEANIRWATRHLKRLYFKKDPRPLQVWLGADAAGYVKITRALQGAPPSSPYGFYLDHQRRMIMNIQTGGGTLVHELVHAYLEANLPGCPPWLNEGLASLYEQVGEKNGRIWGFVNWRLPPLQRAIAEHRTLPFSKLMALSWKEFYDGASDVHYGQSRFLLYWLQQKGRLVELYHRYRKRRGVDPTGVDTLRGILGTPDLEAFRARWERWVMGLRYEPRVLLTRDSAAVKTGDPRHDPEPQLRR